MDLAHIASTGSADQHRGDRRVHVSRGTGDGSQGGYLGPAVSRPEIVLRRCAPGTLVRLIAFGAGSFTWNNCPVFHVEQNRPPSVHYPAAVPTLGRRKRPANGRPPNYGEAIHAYSTLALDSFTPTKPEVSIITVTKLPGVVGWVKLQPKFLQKRPKWTARGLHIRDGSDRGVREGVVLVSDEPTTVFLSQPHCEAEPVLRIVGELRFHSTAEERMRERNILAGRHIQ